MLTYPLNADSKVPLYEQLYSAIRRDIESGELRPDQKLPSKRALASNLGVSVITVEGALSQLLVEGYLYSRPRSGFFVTGGMRAKKSATAEPASVSLPSEPSWCIDLARGANRPDLFPFSRWAKTVREVLSHESERILLGKLPSHGMPRLREAIAAYLHGGRGMDVSGEQILVGAGAQFLYTTLIQLLGSRRVYAVENPGYPRLKKIYRANGVAPRYLALDEGGASVPGDDVDVIHISPSHQFPTGIVMPVARRQELLAWAGDCKYIIEDDYDWEFRFSGMPIPSLQSIDSEGNVIYLNTFTQSLGSAVRIAYAVLPPRLSQVFAQRFSFYANSVSALDQLVLAKFIEDGHYERHISRLRVAYRSVRDYLIDQLGELGVPVMDTNSGLSFLVYFGQPGVPEKLAARGINLPPLSAYLLAPSQAVDGWFYLSFASLTEQAAEELIVSIRQAI